MEESANRGTALAAAVLAAIAAAAGLASHDKGGKQARAAGPDFPTPPPTITVAQATVPADFAGTPAQANFDLYSWLAFVAVNWPSDPATCGPDLQSSILNGADKSPRVWEAYLADSDVYVAPPATPLPWCGGPKLEAGRTAQLPPAVAELSAKTGVRKFLAQRSKASRRLARAFPGVDEAFGGVLTDQNGRFVRYEVHLDRDEYGYLVKNGLWSAAGQGAFSAPVSFPAGPSPYGPTGALEVKAAWKVIGKGDVASRFYTTKAIVFGEEEGSCPRVETMGLVGLHVIHKTRLQQQWIWSTFEQVDNLTTSFRNAACPQSPVYAPTPPAVPCAAPCCAPNTQTAARVSATPCPSGTPTSQYVELDANGNPLNKPVQVVRVDTGVLATSAKTNGAFQKLLAGTVWQNYQLVSTQWVGEAGSPPIHPGWLANVALETFNQGPPTPTDGPVPYPQPGYQPFSAAVTSSCLKCHSVAQRVAVPTPAPGKTPVPKSADFSFIMGEAQ